VTGQFRKEKLEDFSLLHNGYYVGAVDVVQLKGHYKHVKLMRLVHLDFHL
jgi:hypothetical protein